MLWIALFSKLGLGKMFLAEQKRIRVHKSKAHVGSCRNIVVNMKVWKYAENLLDSLICRQIHSSIQMACKWATQSEQDWLFLFIVQYIIATYIIIWKGKPWEWCCLCWSCSCLRTISKCVFSWKITLLDSKQRVSLVNIKFWTLISSFCNGSKCQCLIIHFSGIQVHSSCCLSSMLPFSTGTGDWGLGTGQECLFSVFLAMLKTW